MYLMKPYDDLLERVLWGGENRQQNGTRSIFGVMLRFDLSGGYFPLVTRRHIGIRGIVGELLWVVGGYTDNDTLVELGCNYWTPWCDRKYGGQSEWRGGVDFGPIYGAQLRSFGGRNMDQLKLLIRDIRKNPYSRKLVCSYWNPLDLYSMRLVPCHYSWQVRVRADGVHMDLLMNQRSCDLAVGGPANIAFYSLLLMMLCQQVGMYPGELIWSLGDVHIYNNQIPGVEEYLGYGRSGFEHSPKMNIRCNGDIDSYKPTDFELMGYKAGDKITFPVTIGN